MQWRMGYHGGVVLDFMPVLWRVLGMWLLWMIADLNYVSANYQQIREENLKTILTPTEWMSIIGSTNQDILYSLTYPRVPYINTVPVSGNNNSDPSHVLSLATKHLGTFQVQLEPSPGLLSTNFVALVTDANDTNILDRYHLTADVTRCYYRGQYSALSLCNGIIGILHFTPSHSYFIHPLPDRFHNGTSKPHVIVRKKIESLVDNNNAHCAHENDYENTFLKQKLKKRKTEFSGFVNTKEVVRHRGCNASCNSTNSKSNESSNLTDAESIDKCIKQCDFKSDKLNGKKRSKREFPADSHVFVETAVFVDRDLFDHMKTNFPVNTERELIRFVLAMINAVQLLYHDSSLGRPVNFLLKRLEILREEAPGLSRPPDIDRYLSNFCNWQRTKNPVGDREPQHWDHALILTGLDLYVRGKHGKISSQVVGLAPVAGMCTSTSSCTVNEGRHFESVYVVAHEIGHNLGMRHDGPLADNDCDPSSYIMSPTLGSGKITWSSCSRHYLQKFLDTPQSRCLLDHSSSAGQLDHGAEGALPGERFDANAQCMLKYGRGSRHSSQQPMDDVCRDLHCERERYTWTSHPALEGTTCGYNMWCRAGRCTRKSSSVPGVSSGAIGSSAAYTSALQSATRQEPVHGGWSRWRTTIECASGCLYGEEGRLRSGSTGIAMSTRMCNNPRAQSGGSKCDGIDKKYQACNTQQCMNVPRLTILEFAEQICTRAKEVDKDLTGIGSQKISSDPEEACVVWCQKRNGGTKSRGWTFPDGTVCQTRRNKYNRQSYCINGRCEDFLCDFYEETNHQFFQQHELCPNDHDDNDIMYRNSGNNGLRRRESVPSLTGKVNKESKYSISVNTVWISASACHYNCIVPGIGLRLVMSKELRDESRAGRTSIQTCQPDQYGCGRIKSPFQHASMVCTKYKERVRRLSGLGMQISPALEDPDRPCRVACQDENIAHRFYLVNGEEGWFPFGADCSRGMTEKKAFCISGKCLEFGSDDTPLSQSEFTLPLLSRNRRSLELNNTKVTATLRQHELDEIINKLNQTIRGQIFAGNNFEIDLNNPIQVNIDPNEMPHHYYRQNSYDYANYT